MSFRLSGLAYAPFAQFFALSDGELAARGASRVFADSDFGFPCRVSLDDARAGEELILLTFEHLGELTPYRASGPIFVRRDASRRICEADEIPDYVARRLIAVRAYDAAHMMRTAAVCAGTDAGTEIRRQFEDADIAYIHLHNAARGCFSCKVERT